MLSQEVGWLYLASGDYVYGKSCELVFGGWKPTVAWSASFQMTSSIRQWWRIITLALTTKRSEFVRPLVCTLNNWEYVKNQPITFKLTLKEKSIDQGGIKRDQQQCWGSFGNFCQVMSVLHITTISRPVSAVVGYQDLNAFDYTLCALMKALQLQLQFITFAFIKVELNSVHRIGLNGGKTCILVQSF